jgi:hypothetical protein
MRSDMSKVIVERPLKKGELCRHGLRDRAPDEPSVPYGSVAGSISAKA